MIKFEAAQYFMGTLIEIVIITAEPNPLELTNLAFHKFAQLAELFSLFDPDSELTTVNKAAYYAPAPISPTFYQVIDLALVSSNLSQNYCSIMLAPLQRYWQQLAEAQRLPTDKELAKFLPLADPKLIELDSTNQTIRFLHPEVALDLGGFVKGYAVEQAKEILKAAGVLNGIINAGTSSIAAWGTNLGDQPWQVGIRNLLAQDQIIGHLVLKDQAIATSGTYERGFLIQNCYFAHIFNPYSGWPISEPISTTVVSDSATLAEVAAKPLLFLAIPEALVNFPEVAGAIVQTQDEDNMLQLAYTDGLELYLEG